MKIEVLPQCFSICKLARMPEPAELMEFCFYSRTDEELSLLCPTSCAPAYTLMREDGYRGFRFAGTLDFGLIGIVAHVTALLADKKIPVFAVSTYNTDYIFVKSDFFVSALEALRADGYEISVPSGLEAARQ